MNITRVEESGNIRIEMPERKAQQLVAVMGEFDEVLERLLIDAVGRQNLTVLEEFNAALDGVLP